MKRRAKVRRRVGRAQLGVDARAPLPAGPRPVAAPPRCRRGSRRWRPGSATERQLGVEAAEGAQVGCDAVPRSLVDGGHVEQAGWTGDGRGERCDRGFGWRSRCSASAGAPNQFAPLLLVYREHLSDTVATALFGAYAIGSISGLAARHDLDVAGHPASAAGVVLPPLAPLASAGRRGFRPVADGRPAGGRASGSARRSGRTASGRRGGETRRARRAPGPESAAGCHRPSAGFGGGPLVARVFAKRAARAHRAAMSRAH